MKKHFYRVTVEHLADKNGQDTTHAAPLQFEVKNHDDIFAIVERLQSSSDMKPEDVAAFGVGLKLFGETILDHQDRALFKDFLPHFANFMKQLKKGDW